MTDRLLAKSSKSSNSPCHPEILQGHVSLVLDAAEAILAEVGDDVLAQLALPPARWREPLRRAVMIGAYLHDFGKANDHFQKMLRHKGFKQSVRHEVLSGILCTWQEELRRWLCPDAEAETTFRAAVCATVGHHLQTNAGMSRDVERLTAFIDHDDFKGLLKLGARRLNLGEPPRFNAPLVFALDEERPVAGLPMLPELVGELWREGARWFKEADEETRRWLASVKALVVAADVAGSALPNRYKEKDDRPVKDWIVDSLSRVASAEELKKVVSERLSGGEQNEARNEFQRLVKESDSPVTLVSAGCGAGKTAAAYLWAAEQAVGRKLFFCYPTTGTATEGFSGYVTESRTEGAVIHSRAEADIEEILTTPEDSADKGANGWRPSLSDVRLESLQAWSPPLIVCTVDSVLGLMQNNRRGLFSFPALMRGAFVFDEIHAYDPRLFGSLLHFLKTFKGARVLLMTASLPPPMRKALEGVCKLPEPIRGPLTREEAPRYRLRHVTQDAGGVAWEEARKVLADGGKVLWVVNTVDRAVALYREARKNMFMCPLHLYHSRFRYFERKVKHKAVTEAFDPRMDKGAALAVTTQVAEMSLDLSADLLISDVAPPAALIQRLGRLNRHEDVPGETALALILDLAELSLKDKATPYLDRRKEPSAEFMLAYRWLGLDSLPKDPGPVSQAQLADTLAALYDAPGAADGTLGSAWLDGAWKSQTEPLREADFSVPVVLERDEQYIKAAGAGRPPAEQRREMRREAIRRSLNIPGRDEVGGWPRLSEHKLYRIAPDEKVGYDEETGAFWK
ncbi:MAG: CRISPR-associated helicase Cas3' [Acidobacteriota bacterium]|nr:CRISPR-associated helicase Cas3' [Acidobacteriota bacterium]